MIMKANFWNFQERQMNFLVMELVNHKNSQQLRVF